jgi:hydrogenase expression/formation protein HypD
MEVCGGHTITIHRYNLYSQLPSNINLISGPGCPVCVTSTEFIDQALQLCRQPKMIIATFGDLMRVPGSDGSLLQAQSQGADIRICYSPADAVKIAAQNQERQVVFLAIGFETTAPLIAAAILTAQRERITNFSILSALKTMPQVMRALLDVEEIQLDGFICPGHVSAITGLNIYQFIVDEYHRPCVVTGFEPVDLLTAILQLVEMVAHNRPAVVNQYNRVVRPGGNLKAQAIMYSVFEACDSIWRGLGQIPGSGLKLKAEYAQFDAANCLSILNVPARENPACQCGAVLRGVLKPTDCPLFAKICNPSNPQGACMVSSEGTCATYYKYRRKDG